MYGTRAVAMTGLIALALGAVGVIAAAVLTPTDDRAHQADTKRYRVEQVRKQEWPPFTAQEIETARAIMAGHPTDLHPGEQQAVLIRTIITDHPEIYNCQAIGKCWAALIVLSGDHKPLDYHVVSAYGDNLRWFARCFLPGDRVALGWAAMRNRPNDKYYTGITNANWIRPLEPVRCTG